ncbi:MAG: metal-dependent hydrolase [bacterium]|nr:metal-dependent hydrolase [bacterium]
MTLPTHLMTGLILGKLTGNYSLSVAGALLVDIDHLLSYAKNGLLLKPKEFFKTVFAQDDQYGDQRYFLHNVFVFILISGIVYIIDNKIGFILGIAYFSHLILDALDNSDYFPFFPNKKINIRGPIGYFSKQEFFIILLLVIIFYLV